MNNKIGVLINLRKDTDLAFKFREAKELGFESCQLCVWDMSLYTDEVAQKVNAALASVPGFEVSLLWAGWSGPKEWNFTYGPATLGIVPPAYRDSRTKDLLKASDFAEKIGVKNIATHVGFIPENPDSNDFAGTVAALREICRYYKNKEQYFLFETGQETPVTMLRTMQAIGLDNVGINFDTANLILYGKANTLDALDVYGKYVMNTHIKDGFYPTDGMMLGEEVRAGDGKANLPAVIKRFKELGYTGPFTIEREIKEGEQHVKDITLTRDLLKKWMAEADSE